MTFWTLILGGVFAMITSLVTGQFPQHQSIGLVQRVVELFSSSMTLAFTIVFSNVNMLLPFIVFGLIMAAEVVRWIYSAWRWLKGLIV